MTDHPPLPSVREYTVLLPIATGDGASFAVMEECIRRCLRVSPAPVVVEFSCNDLVGGNSTLAGQIGSAERIPDAVIAVRAAAGAAEHHAGQLAEAIVRELREVMDLGDATALVADRVQQLPGGGPVRIYYGIRRLPTLTKPAFHHYWRVTHGEIGRRLLEPFSYFQCHVLGELTAAFAERCGLAASDLDGVVNIHFPDLAAFNYQTSRPEVGDIALADERNFIDHGRVQFGVMSVKELTVPATPS